MKALFILALLSVTFTFGEDVDAQVGCNPNLLFDATLVFVGDSILPYAETGVPIQPAALDYLLDYCSNFYRTEYGLHTRNWWTGKGQPPKGIMAQASSSFTYRLYGMATPEYRNNFPMTNGKIIDDAMLVIFTQNTTLGGNWAKMQQEMGMAPMVMAGEWIVCGGYRGFQNDSRGVKSLWPNIRYNSMPMMSMWMGDVGNFADADSSVNCNLESDWWGKGVAVGLASVRILPGNMVWSNIRNVLTFPVNTFDRMGVPPRYTRCENTNV